MNKSDIVDAWQPILIELIKNCSGFVMNPLETKIRKFKITLDFFGCDLYKECR